MSESREKKLEKLLAKFIQPIKNIPFEVVVQALFYVEVKKFELKIPSNKSDLEIIAQAMRDVCKMVQQSPVFRNRPNEVGNDMEGFALSALKKNKMEVYFSKTKTGKLKKTGYPDIKIITENKNPIYLEVKTYNPSSKDQTFRSFFLSSSADPKVTETAFHLAVSFEIVQKDKSFYPVSFKIVDLYGLSCDMKAEFNSNNKRLYDSRRILVEGSEKDFRF